MLAAGRRWCRHSFNTACHHARPPAGARGFNIHAIIEQKRRELESSSKDKGTGGLYDTADDDAGTHAEKTPADGIPTNTSPDCYSQIGINRENKTVTTPVGELPISPLMDQSFHDARTRYTKPKPTKIEYKFTKLERRLRRSPYAHALATPIRKSPACTTALPRFFLERFNLLAHPETGDAWIVPTGLNSKVPQGGAPDVADPAEAAWQAALEEASSGEEDPLEDDFAVDEEASLDEEAPLDEEAAPEGDSAANEKATLNEAATKHAPTHLSGTPKGVKTGASSYVLSRQTLFREFVNPASEYFKSEKRLFRMSDHGLARLTPALNRAVWRSDMDTVLLELMRRRVVEGLCYFSRLVESDDRRYITECKQWDDVMELKHKGCLLYLGPPAAGESPSSADYVPPRLSTMDILDDRYTHVIAVHNLPEILGVEHLARLREGCELMRHGSLFHLGRLATLSLQLMIWKLQGYMAWDQPKETTEETAAPPASGEGVSTGNGL